MNYSLILVQLGNVLETLHLREYRKGTVMFWVVSKLYSILFCAQKMFPKCRNFLHPETFRKFQILGIFPGLANPMFIAVGTVRMNNWKEAKLVIHVYM